MGEATALGASGGKTWLDSGLGRDLNIRIGRQFGSEWNNNDYSGPSRYKGISKSSFRISTIFYNESYDGGQMRFGGFESYREGGHRTFQHSSHTEDDRSIFYNVNSADVNHMINAQNLHSGTTSSLGF